MRWNSRTVNTATLALIVCGLAAGLICYALELPQAASASYGIAALLSLLPLSAAILGSFRDGKMGVDIIALLAIVGALALGESLTAAVIALMVSGGQALEHFADARARRELSALLDRAPRTAHRSNAGSVADIPIEEVKLGDMLLVKPGEVVPVDGVVMESIAVLDEAALTGESVPVQHAAGEQVRSGAVNAAQAPFQMRAIAIAKDSTYAGIVRLVEQAQASKARLVRMADRFAIYFLPMSIAAAAVAWAISGKPERALAVLVIATPCPLILAAPVAMVAGISRAARRGIIVKGGAALETLGRATILVLDKTGTVTGGAPVITETVSFGQTTEPELLRLAASLDQVSPHVLAGAILRAARERGLSLSFPTAVQEELGSGIRGNVDGHRVALGRGGWVLGDRPASVALKRLRRRTLIEGSTSVILSIDGELAGALIVQDPIRPDAPSTLRALRRTGWKKIYLLTGDHDDIAKVVGAVLGVDRVFSERTPQEKVDTVRQLRGEGVTVMVGDGVNDAPALAAADAGVALGARGATASSQAADVVLLVDRLDRLSEGIRIARRSRAIALQSILAGMGLSLAGMVLAIAGLLPPIAGALAQEGIDVLVILNALRALRGGRAESSTPAQASIGQEVRSQHRELLPGVKRIREAAERLDTAPASEIRPQLDELRRFLERDVIPHNEGEDARVFPVVAKMMGGLDPTAAMSRAHLEIAHLVNLFGRTLDDLPPNDLPPEDIQELRRILYGLNAILVLHFAQEEESYLSLLDDGVEPQTAQRSG